MAPAGFLIYYAYEDEAPAVAGRQRLATAARRTATVVAVLALVTFLGLTVGPVFQS